VRFVLSSSRVAAACRWPSIARGFFMPWPPLTNSIWQSFGNPSCKWLTQHTLTNEFPNGEWNIECLRINYSNWLTLHKRHARVEVSTLFMFASSRNSNRLEFLSDQIHSLRIFLHVVCLGKQNRSARSESLLPLAAIQLLKTSRYAFAWINLRSSTFV